MPLLKEEVELAKLIGIVEVQLISQVHYWEIMGYGEESNGVVYVWNKYETWKEQCWVSLSSIKRAFKKLVSMELLFQKKHGKNWDHTQAWGINYSHPLLTSLVSKWYARQCQNEQLGSVNLTPRYNTDTYPKITANTTPHVVEPNIPTGETPYNNRTRTKQTSNKTKWSKKNFGIAQKESSASGEDYKKAVEWIASLDMIDGDRVRKYIKDQLSNNPKILNPIGYERYVTTQVWYKQHGMENHCNFVPLMGNDDKEIQSIKVVSETEEQRLVRVNNADMTFDEEMQQLQEEL